jgi:hypothetical protein
MPRRRTSARVPTRSVRRPKPRQEHDPGRRDVLKGMVAAAAITAAGSFAGEVAGKLITSPAAPVVPAPVVITPASAVIRAVGIEPTVRVAETVIVKVVRGTDPAKDKPIEV